MGTKTEARRRMAEAGVPVVPGSPGLVSDSGEARAVAEQIGYPVMVKAALGGVGSGMRLVERPEDLTGALEMAASEAQKAFANAIVLDSMFALAHYRLAYANWWGGESDEIQRTQLDRAMALSHRLPERFRFLLRAQNAVNEEGYEAGLNILVEMEAIYPDDKEMVYNIGDFSFHTGKYAQAAAYLERSLETDPASERALNHLTLTYSAMKAADRAVETGRRYADVARSEAAYITLSNAYLQAGDTEGALAAVMEGSQASPDNPWLLQQAATVRCMQDDFEFARAVLDSLAHNEIDAVMPERLRYAALRGLMGANLYLGRYREALDVLDEMIEFSTSRGDTMAVAFHLQKKGFLHLWGWDDRGKAAVEFDAARDGYVEHAGLNLCGGNGDGFETG